MKGHSYTSIFRRLALDFWERTTELVEGLPEDPELRCHELARAVARYFEGDALDPVVVDGKFGIADHSWLIIGRDKRIYAHVLDVYAVGSLPMVQLVDVMSVSIRRARQYVPGEVRSDIRTDVIDRLLATWKQAQNRPTASPL